MRLRYYILLLLLLFGLTPLLLAVVINLPLVLDRTALFYQKAYLQNLRADFRDLDQHLASRDEMIRMLAKLPEPGIILGDAVGELQIDLARARYTGWINQMLADQVDIIQILFIDADGNERFWLRRDPQTREWHPTEQPPEPPSQGFVDAGLKLQPGEVIFSRIRINPHAASADPRQMMTLQLASPIGGEPDSRPRGLLLMTIDVAGLAQFYRDTLWVNDAGSYLRPGKPISNQSRAFTDFPGLEQIFAEDKLALWRGGEGPPLLWVPMFMTEDAAPLWVGRPVDPSPLEDFRDALILRVLSIVLILVLTVMGIAHWLASRAERLGQELTSGIETILRNTDTRRFDWGGPREVRALASQLNALARTHAEHVASERQHTRQLEQSNRYKSEFLANVSHELRTPLNAILLLSKMLAAEESGLDGEQRRQARVINEAGRDLRAMIDNILDISRIEAGAVTVSLEWVELAPMLAELARLVRPLFGDKGLAFRVEHDPQAPTRVYTDRGKLGQILKNFLSNAVKFTEHGSVVVTVSPDRPPYAVAISVTDTGIGIPPGKEQIIFDAFQQADGSTRRRYGGTGLGLSISRELTQLLGGRIDVDSTLGQGSRFTLRLPLSVDTRGLESVEIIQVMHGGASPSQDTQAPAVPAPQPLPVDQGQHWVLLVERDVQSLVAVASQLETLGVRVQTAADGEEALETLAEERDCALLLLAAQEMPEHPAQGRTPNATPNTTQDAIPAPTPDTTRKTCDTIRHIRDDMGLSELPIVILGSLDQEQRRRCLEAGAHGFLQKPIADDALAGLVTEVLDTATGSTATPQPSA
ncbi:response regulator [Thiohalocapsa marina]|uniref:histidine kinase n=1 Tax=Thiohalocapsa marina TaxID=424902 RepID=A0A5M8FP91_9GAMM|nr:ATP-binding protein [Thiohalocapsa marina]KAA6186589.1 response regulator [Thiohalocapsa marina]